MSRRPLEGDERRAGPPALRIVDDWARVLHFVEHARSRWLGLALLGGAVALAVALAQLALEPVYRTQAKVRVEAGADEVARGGLAPGVRSTDDASSQLRSRTFVERFVGPPTDGAVVTPEHPEAATKLGLTTWVTDTTRSPLARALRRWRGQGDASFELFARARQLDEAAPRSLRLRFVAADRVAVTAPSGDGPLDEYTWSAAAPLIVGGIELALETRGAWDDREFLVELLTPEEAALRVLAALRVDAQQHQEGTLGLTVSDADPRRAAAVANALANGLVQLGEERSRGAAAVTLTHLGEELEQRRVALAAAEARISALLQASPELASRTTAVTALTARQAELEAEEARLAALRIELEALALDLVSGDRSVLARASVALEGSAAERIVADIRAHQSELVRVTRGEASGYRETLRTRSERHEQDAQRVGARLLELTEVIALVESGDTTALARLDGALGSTPGSLGAPMTGWLAELAQERAAFATLAREWTEEYPPLLAQRTRVDAAVATVVRGLQAQQAALSAELERERGYAAHWAGLFAEYPGSEAALIEAALYQLHEELADTLAARARGLLDEAHILADQRLGVIERLRELRTAEVELSPLELERDELRALVATLVREVAQVELAAATASAGVTVVDSALVPRRRSKPNAGFAWMVGLLSGCVTAGIAALIGGARAFRGERDVWVESDSGLPIIGRVPRMPARPDEHDGGAHLPLLDAPGSAAADAFRVLRGRLDVATAGARTLGFLARVEGAGASDTAVGLALARAQTGARVCLVDADLRRPFVLDTFGHEAGPGLAEALDGRRHWRQCLRPGPIPGLSLLGAGALFGDPADLFDGAELRALVEDLAAHHDLVVFDLPPATRSAEVEALARRLDAVVVLDDERMAPGALERTIQELRRCGARPVGLVRVDTLVPHRTERRTARKELESARARADRSSPARSRAG